MDNPQTINTSSTNKSSDKNFYKFLSQEIYRKMKKPGIVPQVFQTLFQKLGVNFQIPINYLRNAYQILGSNQNFDMNQPTHNNTCQNMNRKLRNYFEEMYPYKLNTDNNWEFADVSFENLKQIYFLMMQNQGFDLNLQQEKFPLISDLIAKDKKNDNEPGFKQWLENLPNKQSRSKTEMKVLGKKHHIMMCVEYDQFEFYNGIKIENCFYKNKMKKFVEKIGKIINGEKQKKRISRCFKEKKNIKISSKLIFEQMMNNNQNQIIQNQNQQNLQQANPQHIEKNEINKSIAQPPQNAYDLNNKNNLQDNGFVLSDFTDGHSQDKKEIKLQQREKSMAEVKESQTSNITIQQTTKEQILKEQQIYQTQQPTTQISVGQKNKHNQKKDQSQNQQENAKTEENKLDTNQDQIGEESDNFESQYDQVALSVNSSQLLTNLKKKKNGDEEISTHEQDDSQDQQQFNSGQIIQDPHYFEYYDFYSLQHLSFNDICKIEDSQVAAISRKNNDEQSPIQQEQNSQDQLSQNIPRLEQSMDWISSMELLQRSPNLRQINFGINFDQSQSQENSVQSEIQQSKNWIYDDW